MKKVTIRDVAIEAHVSIATASRALSGRDNAPGKSPKHERVRAVAAALGYVSLSARRAAVEERTKILGCLVPDLANPFYGELAQTVIDQARSNGYEVVVVTIGESGTRHATHTALTRLMKQRTQGIVAVPTGSSVDADMWQEVADRNIALVLVDRDLGNILERVDTVTVNNRKGARDATWHLFLNGHSRVGLLAGPWQTASTLHARVEGFRDAHRDRRVDLDEDLIVGCSFDPAERLQAARNVLAMRPSAVLASSNLLGESMLAAIREREGALEFPDDISLVMFDDVPWARLMKPRITTVSNPPADLAMTAISLLLYRLKQHRTPARHALALGGELHVRDSVLDRRVSMVTQIATNDADAIPSVTPVTQQKV